MKNLLPIFVGLLALVQPYSALANDVAEANKKVVSQYYEAYNKGDVQGQVALMSDDVVYEPNQGTPKKGKAAYIKFATELNETVKEKCVDIETFVGKNPNRIATEFHAVGTYVKTSEGSPVAKNQKYNLRAGEFFEIKDGKIVRLSTHYNEQEWQRQIAK